MNFKNPWDFDGAEAAKALDSPSLDSEEKVLGNKVFANDTIVLKDEATKFRENAKASIKPKLQGINFSYPTTDPKVLADYRQGFRGLDEYITFRWVRGSSSISDYKLQYFPSELEEHFNDILLMLNKLNTQSELRIYDLSGLSASNISFDGEYDILNFIHDNENCFVNIRLAQFDGSGKPKFNTVSGLEPEEVGESTTTIDYEDVRILTFVPRGGCLIPKAFEGYVVQSPFTVFVHELGHAFFYNFFVDRYISHEAIIQEVYHSFELRGKNIRQYKTGFRMKGTVEYYKVYQTFPLSERDIRNIAEKYFRPNDSERIKAKQSPNLDSYFGNPLRLLGWEKIVIEYIENKFTDRIGEPKYLVEQHPFSMTPKTKGPFSVEIYE